MKLKKEDLFNIAKLIDEGKSYLEIAFIYKTGKTYMHNLVRRYQVNKLNFVPGFIKK